MAMCKFGRPLAMRLSSRVNRTLCPALLLCVSMGAHGGVDTSAMTTEQLSASARDGNAQAQYELGYRFSQGKGVALDKDRALRLYIASAQGGSAQGAYEVAKHYSGVTGGTLDLHQSHAYLHRAAELGFVPAQADLGFAYYNGNEKVEKNLALAFQWLKKAAENGSVGAQCMIGDFYKKGLGGVRQSYSEAFKWYELTAHAQDKCAPKSQYELYESYASGRGAKRDLATAIAWLKKAAEAGNPTAQVALGRAYRSGAGVPRDEKLATAWLRKSREGVAPHDEHEHDDHGLGQGHAHGHRRGQ